jgi:hypothetical protein
MSLLEALPRNSHPENGHAAGSTKTIRNQYDDLRNDRTSRTAHMSCDEPSGRIRSIISANSRKRNAYAPSTRNSQAMSTIKQYTEILAAHAKRMNEM